MSTTQAGHACHQEPNRKDHLSRALSDEAVLRATGILALTGIAVIHFVQLVQTFKDTPVLGAAFVVLVLASVAAGIRLLTSGAPLNWVGAGLVSMGAIVGYVFTRSMSSPLDNQDVGNWAEMLGLAAVFVEAALVALSTYAIATRRSLVEDPSRLLPTPKPGPTHQESYRVA